MSDNKKLAGMVDITEKPSVFRTAKASGIIRLRKGTIDTITRGEVKKGDVFNTARIASIMAVKDTPRYIPLCHSISITGVDVIFQIDSSSCIIKAEVQVKSLGKTGVEMEALSGVTAALLNIWDMVKYLEKDETGNYPETEISKIRVEEKKKRSA